MALELGQLTVRVVPEVEWTHASPRAGESVTPCCGRAPLEFPRYHRLTIDPVLVTCPALVLRMKAAD